MTELPSRAPELQQAQAEKESLAGSRLRRLGAAVLNRFRASNRPEQPAPLENSAEYEQYKSDKLDRYQEFDPLVAHLLEEIRNLPDGSEHPAFIGTGMKAETYQIELNGGKYAARIIKKRDWASVDDYLHAGLLGNKVPHLEQFCAANPDRGITISEMMPGKQMRKITAEDIEAITDKQLSELVDTIVTMDKRGIWLDADLGNMLYDQETGFNFIDQRVKTTAHKGSVGSDIGEVVSTLSSMGLGYDIQMAPEERAHGSSVFLGVLGRLKGIVENKLEEPDRETAFEAIDAVITSRQEYRAKYLSPR